jgi:dihydroxyacetone kinase-like predicted kinase
MQLQGAERTRSLAEGSGVDPGSAGLVSAAAAPTAKTGTNGAADTPLKEVGYVAVASGKGNVRILESLGVDFVVQGGQTMNPSTKDFVDAIDAVRAKSVILFPNNKNIIMAATAAAENASKPALVVPTKSVPQSFSALFVADPEAGLEANAEAMTEAAAEVKTAEITVAIKEAKAADGSPIAEGDVIGITAGSIEVVGSDVSDVALELAALIAEDADVLTLLAGEDFDDEHLQALSSRIEDKWPMLEIDSQRGDQPLYPLILAAE